MKRYAAHVYDSAGAYWPARSDFVLAYMDYDRSPVNLDLAHSRFPLGRILQATVKGAPGVRVIDSERGTLSPEQTAELVAAEHTEGRRPWVYCAGYRRPLIAKVLAGSYGLTDTAAADWWLASWDGVPVIPEGWQAKQYASADDPGTMHLTPVGCDVSVAWLDTLLLADSAKAP